MQFLPSVQRHPDRRYLKKTTQKVPLNSISPLNSLIEIESPIDTPKQNQNSRGPQINLTLTPELVCQPILHFIEKNMFKDLSVIGSHSHKM